MKRTMKKAAAFLLTLLMVVNMSPASILADTNTGEYGALGLSNPNEAEQDGVRYKLESGNASVVGLANGYTGSVTVPASITVSGKTYPVTSIAENAFKGKSNLDITIQAPDVVVCGAYGSDSANHSSNTGAFSDVSNSHIVFTGKNVTVKNGAFIHCSDTKIESTYTGTGGSFVLDQKSFAFCKNLDLTVGSGQTVNSGSIYNIFQGTSGKMAFLGGVANIGGYSFYGCSNLSVTTTLQDTYNWNDYGIGSVDMTINATSENYNNAWPYSGTPKSLTINCDDYIAEISNAGYYGSYWSYQVFMNFNGGIGKIKSNAFANFRGKNGSVITIEDNANHSTTVESSSFPISSDLTVRFNMPKSSITGSNILDAYQYTHFEFLPETGPVDSTNYCEEGKEQILLSYLMSNIEVTKNIDVTQVASVSFPEADGIAQQEVSGNILYNRSPEEPVNVGTKDFLLSKDSVFTTGQVMTVTLNSGRKYYPNRKYTAATQEFTLSDLLTACDIGYGDNLSSVTVQATSTGESWDDGYFEISTVSGAEISGDKSIKLTRNLVPNNTGKGAGILRVSGLPNVTGYVQILLYQDGNLNIRELTDDAQIFKVRIGKTTPATVIITGLADSYDDENGNLVIPAKVTIDGTEYPVSEIEKEAFAGEDGIKSVTFSNGSSPVHIGESAFINCGSLERVTGDGLVTYDYTPFRENPELVSLSISLAEQPASILCCYNPKLETAEITYSDVMDYVPQSMFYGNDSLHTVIIPGGVKEIRSGSFLNCPELTELILGNQGDNAGQALLINQNALTPNTKLASAVTVQQTVISSAGTVVLDADPNGVRIGAMLVRDYVNADDADPAILAKAAEYFDGYGYDLQHMDLKLVAPDGETPVNAKALVNVKVYFTELADITIFHKTETAVDTIPLKAFETGDTENYYTVRNDKIVTAVFSTDSFSPFAIGGHDMSYHDDMFRYDLIVDENTGTVTGAVITGIFNQYTGTELVFTGTTRDENAYPVATVGNGAFNGNGTITSVVFSNSSEMTVLGSAFYNMSALKTMEINGTGLLRFAGEDWHYPVGYCRSLTSITGTGPVSFEAMGIFYGCSSLTTVKLGAVKKINQNTFIDNTALVSFEAESVEEIGTQAFNRCTGLDSVIVLGKVNIIRKYAFDGCTAVRVAAFNEIGTMYSYAFSAKAFSQDNHLVYIGRITSVPNNNAFGYDSQATVWFNMTFDDLWDATGGNTSSRLGTDYYKYSTQYYSPDMYVSVGGYGDEGTIRYPYYSFESAMGSMYYAVDGLDDFKDACEAAGVSEYNFVFRGAIRGDFDGITLHVLPGKVGRSGATQDPAVTFPANMYSSYVNKSAYISNAPATYNFLKRIVFEDGVTEIIIPDNAMAEFPNLESVEVKNSDAVVTIGANAFAGTKVNTVCNAKQIVSSRDGVVTLEKNAGAPIGTALKIAGNSGSSDADIIQAARNEGMFDGMDDDDISIRYFDLSLVAPDGTEVHKPASVKAVQKLNVYTGADTIPPKLFGFFHIADGAATMVTNDFTPDPSTGVLTFSFDTEGFSPFAAAFTTDTELISGIYTYLVDGDGNATITGYGPDFTGNVLNIPAETEEIDGKTYRIVGIANDALKNPPEGITITSVAFNNTDSLIVGSGAMSGISTIESIDFAGEGYVEFNDASAFEGSGTDSVAVNMAYGLTATTSDGGYSTVFSGLNGLYTLTLGEEQYVPISIPAGAFRNDTKLQAVTVVCGLADSAEFDPDYSHNVPRGSFDHSAVGSSAFEGATALERFTVEEGDEFSIGNEAFKDCTALTELTYTGDLRGLGENALRNTGFTRLTLKGSDMYLGKNAMSDCSGLQSVVIDGDVERLSEEVFAGATRLEQLTFNGKVRHQLNGSYIRAEKLKVLVFKKGVGGMLDSVLYTEESVTADSLNIYVGGEYDDNPYIEGEALPSAQDNIRIYMNLPRTREKAHQSNDLDQEPNVVDLAYSLDEAPKDMYVDTDADTAANQNGTQGAPFSSFEKALEATTKEYDHASRFRAYFSDAGYDPDANGLTFTEGNFSMNGFTLHVVGGTEKITGEFQGNEMIGAVVIAADGDVDVSDEAFKACPNLTSVMIEDMDGEVRIGESAFENCTGLETLEIDSRYTYYQEKPDIVIGQDAFKNCSKLPEITVHNASDITIATGAFENCALLDKLYIPRAGSITVEAEAFKDTPLKEIDIENSNVSLKEDAFRGQDTLTSVMVNTTGTVTIEAGAFSECGEIDVVQLLGNKAPTVETDAFSETAVGVLRIQSGLTNVADGGFDGGTSYIDTTETFNTSLAAKTGGFKNNILPNAKSIDADKQVFGGNDALERVYLGANSDTNGGIAGDVFSGMPDDAVAYVAHKRGDFTDANRPTRDGTLRFLDDDGYLYIDGTNTNEHPDGSRDNGFRTFDEAKQYAAEHAKTGTDRSSDYYYTDAAETLRDAFEKTAIDYKEIDIRFPVPSAESDNRVFKVVGTVTVSENETWDSDEGDTITLLRYAGNGTDPAFTDALVRVTGNSTLQLNHVVLDGNSTDAAEPLIAGNAGTTIEIHDGAQLRNNINTLLRWDGTISNYVSGGAIRTNGNVTMDGGLIDGNTAVNGGGICMGSGLLEMSGGVISNNTTNGNYDQVSYNYGGGVLLTGEADMNMSDGAVISGNKAVGGSGGGIALGTGYINNYCTLNMTGGSISGNESTYEGGGLYIQIECEANVSGGSFTGNTSHGGVYSPNYGGGAIYVNGTHGFYKDSTGKPYNDGVLRLTQVYISGNSAAQEGGGIASCSTSSAHIFITKGSAIYNNKSRDNADLFFDDTTLIWYMKDKTIMLPANMEAVVSPYMWNGTPYNWINAETNQAVSEEELSSIRNEEYHLRAEPGEGAPDSGSVVITGNHSDSKGGGIGSNGTVIIGYPPEGKAEWTPEVSKILHNRDMEEGEAFTFDIYREQKDFFQTGTDMFGSPVGIYTYREDEYIGQGTVTEGKDGVPKQIDIEPIEISDLTAADVGKTYTYLILETTESKPGLITDSENYLAFNVAIGMAVKDGEEYYTAKTVSVSKGTYTINSEGKPVFETRDWMGDKNIRYRSWLYSDEVVFNNYSNDTSVSADKAWLNYDGSTTPPAGAKVTFRLLADGKAAKNLNGNPVADIELDGTTDENGEYKAWSAKWSNLPALRTDDHGELVTDDDGNYVKISYKVKEIKVELPADSYASYISNVPNNGLAATNVKPAAIRNIQEKGRLTISKKVVSPIAADETKEYTFTVALTDQTINGTFSGVKFNQGKATIKVTGKASVTIEGLPVGVGYTVSETIDGDFELDGQNDHTGVITAKGTTESFTNRRILTTATVRKVWDDAENLDGIRPAELKITLSNGAEVTLNEENKWTATVEDLPKYADGKEIVYSWTEDKLPAGYTLTGTATEGTVTTLTNSHTPETTTATVKKVWDDAENQDGKRPTELKVTLSNGTEVTLNAANEWTATVENLPKYTDSHEIIVYTWTEANLPAGYALTSTVSEGTVTTLTNSYTPETTTATVKKVWNDAEDQDGRRPAELKVTLSNGTEVTLNEENKWTATVEGLPKYADGKEIVYTWTEDILPAGYTLTGTATEGTVTTLTNSHTPGRTTATVKKVWDDMDNLDGSRPERITVTLLANGEAVQTFELNRANEWTAAAENLPMMDGDGEITYTWTEQAVDGYTLTVTTAGDTTTLTNRHVPELTSLTVRKEWDDDGNEGGLRPYSIEMTLLANGTGIRKVTLNAENEWSAAVNNLPVSYGGETVVYDWTEQTVANYEPESKTTVNGVTVFRNRVTKVPEDQRNPRVPRQQWREIPDYDTALGLGTLINHVGDCFD